MPDPFEGTRQTDELVSGFSLARAVTSRTEIVGEINGRASVRTSAAAVGTESRGRLKLGGRFTRGPIRFDAGIFFGLNAVDPTVGVTAGVTYIFNAFRIP